MNKLVQLPPTLKNNPLLKRWVSFEQDGVVTLRSGKVELGQGILTAIAQMGAEELGVSISQVKVAPLTTPISPSEASTTGSRSIQEGGEAMRFACAEIRDIFAAAAAKRLGVPKESVQTKNGVFSCSHNSGRPPLSLSYWQLSAGVSLDVEVSGAVSPKHHSQYSLVGSSARRLDLRGKITGSKDGQAVFLHDIELPGMLHGRMVRPPSFHARLISVDTAVALGLSGVLEVVHENSFLGVIAEREETAIKAAQLLASTCTWREQECLPDEGALANYLFDQASEDEVLSGAGLEYENPKSIQPKSAKTFELTSLYTRPYLSHASIGPSCGIACWTDESLEVWSHSQSIYALRDEIAKILELPKNFVVAHHADGSGCYGHNGADDVTFDAAVLAGCVRGKPVRVQWMRDEEFNWSPMGPAMALKISAVVSSSGQIERWDQEIWGNRHISRPGRSPEPGLLGAWLRDESLQPPPPVDMPIAMGGGSQRNAVPYYEFPNKNVLNHATLPTPIRSSALRALGAYLNIFSIESFMDELANKAQIDPVTFRINHLQDPRAIEVIKSVVKKAGWEPGRALAENEGIGIAFARYKNIGNYAAVIAHVEVVESVRVKHVYASVDCGCVINPDGVINQCEGGIIQVLSWCLKERLRFDRTRITTKSWDDYPIFKFSDVPLIDIELINRPECESLGVGEGVTGPTAAAVANAVYNALKVRVRDLPMDAENIIKSINAQES